MEKDIKKDIISVLQQTISLIEKEDFPGLKELSNHTIHDASIFQDQDSIQIAVIVHALSKILEREKGEGKKTSISVTKTIDRAINFLAEDKEEQYRNEIKNIFRQISETDQQLLLYVQNVIEKANIAKGTKIYEHGISIGRISEILGITQWDLMSFIGKTKISDRDDTFYDAGKRLAFARKLFRVP